MHRKSILHIIGGQNQVRVTKGHEVQIFKKVFLRSYAQEKHFKHHRKSKSGQGHQRSSSANFWKVYFWAPMPRERILDIIEGQNVLDSPKVIKCTFSKRVFASSYTQEKHLRQYSRVSKSATFTEGQVHVSKIVFLSSHAQGKHFKHHRRSKTDQGIRGHQLQMGYWLKLV